MEECPFKASLSGQQEPGEAVHAPSTPRGARGQPFFVVSFSFIELVPIFLVMMMVVTSPRLLTF